MKFKYLQTNPDQWAVYSLAEGEEIRESAPIATLHKLPSRGPWAVAYLGADHARPVPGTLPEFPTWEEAEQWLFMRLHCRDALAPLETAQAGA